MKTVIFLALTFCHFNLIAGNSVETTKNLQKNPTNKPSRKPTRKPVSLIGTPTVTPVQKSSYSHVQISSYGISDTKCATAPESIHIIKLGACTPSQHVLMGTNYWIKYSYKSNANGLGYSNDFLSQNKLNIIC